MPDILSSDDLNTLAAEYVLGTLDYEERNGASALLEVDPTFRGIVRIWEKRFGELHLMVETVPPDAKLWERIRPQIAGIEQAPTAIPSIALETTEPSVTSASVETSIAPPAVETTAPTGETAAPNSETATPAASLSEDATAEAERKLAELAALRPAAAEQVLPTPAPAPTPEEPMPAEEGPRGFVPPAPMIRRATPAAAATRAGKSGRGWMAVSLAMGLVAVMLAGLISAWRFFPERLPVPLRAYTVLKIPVPAPPPPPLPARPPAFDE